MLEKKVQARENFITLLESQGTQLNYLSRYYDVSRRLQRDPRFRAIDERDREDVYQEFIEKLGEQERENKLAQSKQRIEQLREEFRSENTITLETRWKDIDAIVESRKAVKPLYNEATPMEYLTAFEDTMKELEHENAMQKK